METTTNTNTQHPKLLPYQHSHAENIEYSLKRYGRALDLSQTGTGKSYVSSAVCANLKLRPLIICPKSLVSMWPKVLDEFGVEPCKIYNILIHLN